MTRTVKKASIIIMAVVFIATICMPIAILPSKVYADGVPYVIGDTGPAGGKIFYDKGNDIGGWRYLEAAPNDQGVSIWSNIPDQLGTTGTNIGTGQANTTAIIGQTGHTESAAKLCDDLVLNGYSDWFLPSREELEEMWNSLADTPTKRTGNGFLNNNEQYWSSSEGGHYTEPYEYYSAYYMDISDGSTWDGPTKGTSGHVRAIRAFSGMKGTATAIEPVWVRTQEMTCKQVWINKDNKFQFSFIYPYRDNNWVKIYDMSGKEVFSIDMPYDNPNIIVDLPDGMYTVKTFNDQPEPIQTFIIGK